MNELDRIEERAQRHLDGMTVNRDALARDTLKLCRALRRVVQELAEASARAGRKPKPANKIFDDIFGI